MQSRRFMPFAAVVGAALVVSGCAKPASSADSSASAAAAAVPASAHVAAAGDPAKGALIFATNCAACHGTKGAGGGVGPALIGERKRKSTSAAVAWIENPQPPMPKLYPAPLSQSDVANVAAYVESL
jgi:mono/diheme cytochrome c family protein